jgi:hypothetical protein
MPVIPATPYSQIRDQLQTGDILSFEGSQPLDFMINLLEEGVYSHVGIVIRDETYGLLFWDAPGGGNLFPDPYLNNVSHAGCRVANLDDILAYYMADMGIQTFTWRQLTPVVPIEGQVFADLVAWIISVDGAPFPGTSARIPAALLFLIQKYFPNVSTDSLDQALGLLLTYLTGAVLLIPTSVYFFCAQLAALTYMQLGLLPTAPLPANGYAPANFNDEPVPLVLTNGTLGMVTSILWDGPGARQS